MIYKPWNYQEFGKQHIIDNPGCGLFQDMGLGKTVTTLTAVDLLMNDYMEVNKCLVIAPLKVARDTWPDEIEKWNHLQHLKISCVLGSEAERIAALKKKADIYTINCENVAWLVSYYGMKWPFDCVVFDESSKFKNQASARFKAIQRVLPFIKRKILLTGTPAPNNLIDIWAQIYLLDKGKRLGDGITKFREAYFNRAFNGHGYEIRSKADEETIFKAISDICISMAAKDYIDMPERVDNIIKIKLNAAHQKMYDAFEEEQILNIADEEITAINAAALTNKLLQFANGAVYNNLSVDENGKLAAREYKVVHDEKLDKLEELIDAAQGKPVLVFYSYKHDLIRIKKRFPGARELKTSQDQKDWNAGKIEILIAHPASAGHGLNLQAGGNIIVWFGLPWSLELYQQANARLYRQGQLHTVIIHHLIIKGTMDEQVLKVLAGKATLQNALMAYVKAKIAGYN